MGQGCVSASGVGHVEIGERAAAGHLHHQISTAVIGELRINRGGRGVVLLLDPLVLRIVDIGDALAGIWGPDVGHPVAVIEGIVVVRGSPGMRYEAVAVGVIEVGNTGCVGELIVRQSGNSSSGAVAFVVV
jgi:hypothetical protein